MPMRSPDSSILAPSTTSSLTLTSLPGWGTTKTCTVRWAPQLASDRGGNGLGCGGRASRVVQRKGQGGRKPARAHGAVLVVRLDCCVDAGNLAHPDAHVARLKSARAKEEGAASHVLRHWSVAKATTVATVNGLSSPAKEQPLADLERRPTLALPANDREHTDRVAVDAIVFHGRQGQLRAAGRVLRRVPTGRACSRWFELGGISQRPVEPPLPGLARAQLAARQVFARPTARSYQTTRTCRRGIFPSVRDLLLGVALIRMAAAASVSSDPPRVGP